jgi:hypothetical protein
MEQFRRGVLDEGLIKDLTFVKNKAGWVFEGVEHRYTIAMFAFSRSSSIADKEVPLRGPFPDAESYERALETDPPTFPAEKAKGWAGSATIPLLPAYPGAEEVFNQLESHPRLDLDEPGEWRARPLQEFNATTDKKMDDGTQVMHFTDDPPDGYWPVFKGESFGIWNPDTGTRYAWVDPDVAIDYAQEKRENSYRYAGSRSPYYEMDEDWVHDKDTLPCFSPRIAFRDVARNTDTRTMISALVPPKLFLTHKAPTLIWPRGDEGDEAYLLGVLSSIPLDWYARRFVELTMSFGIFNSFPIPRPNPDATLRQRVIQLSGRLAAIDDRYADWADAVGVDYGPLDEDTRQEKIYELDAVVAHLYGLSRDHVEVIFETFHDGWDYEERLERVLDYYADWADRLDLDHADREAERAAGTRNDD